MRTARVASQVRTTASATSAPPRPSTTDQSGDPDIASSWTSTALSWLQPYVDDPLPASQLTVDATTNAFRASTDDASSLRLLTTLQRQAVTDAVLLPISQSDETVWVRQGADIADGSYGPGWQLGLFGITA